MSTNHRGQWSTGRKGSRSLARALKPIFDKPPGENVATAFIRKPVPDCIPDLSTLSLFSELDYAISEQSETLPPSPPTPAISQLYRLPAFTLSQFSFDQFKYRDLTRVPKLSRSKGPSVPTCITPPQIQETPEMEFYQSYQSYQSNPFFPNQPSPPVQKTRPTPIPSTRPNRFTDFSIQDPGVPTVRCYIEPQKAEAPRPSLRKVDGKNNLRALNGNSQNRSESYRSLTDHPRSLDEKPASTYSDTSSLSIHALDHFKAFCILDTMLPGNPVFKMSSNLGYSELSRGFVAHGLFLNIQQGDKDGLDFIACQNEKGDFLHYLVLFGAFLSVSGQDRYILASMIDVSHLVDAILEDDPEEDVWQSLASETASKKVSSTDTLSLDDAIQEAEGIWSATTHNDQSRPRSRQSSSSGPSNEGLRNFMDSMQNIYKDYFCLSRSHADSSYYEISLLSPSLKEDGEYLEGHFKHTPDDTIQELAANMAKAQSFSVGVRWGSNGVEKRLYCTPVFGVTLESWVCMLVDGDLPMLWDM